MQTRTREGERTRSFDFGLEVYEDMVSPTTFWTHEPGTASSALSPLKYLRNQLLKEPQP